MKEFLPLMKIYKELPPDIQRYLAKNPDPRWIRFISELCLNIQHKQLPLKKNQVSKLRKASKLIKNLAKKTTSAKNRKRIIQKGHGLIPLLLGTVAPLLLNLFKK